MIIKLDLADGMKEREERDNSEKVVVYKNLHEIRQCN